MAPRTGVANTCQTHYGQVGVVPYPVGQGWHFQGSRCRHKRRTVIGPTYRVFSKKTNSHRHRYEQILFLEASTSQSFGAVSTLARCGQAYCGFDLRHNHICICIGRFIPYLDPTHAPVHWLRRVLRMRQGTFAFPSIATTYILASLTYTRAPQAYASSTRERHNLFALPCCSAPPTCSALHGRRALHYTGVLSAVSDATRAARPTRFFCHGETTVAVASFESAPSESTCGPCCCAEALSA